MNCNVDDLLFMHLNVRGFLLKTEELKVTLKERNIEMCSLNETFLDSKTKVDILGYHITRNDR